MQALLHTLLHAFRLTGLKSLALHQGAALPQLPHVAVGVGHLGVEHLNGLQQALVRQGGAFSRGQVPLLRAALPSRQIGTAAHHPAPMLLVLPVPSLRQVGLGG